MAVARSCINHSIWFDLRYLVRAFLGEGHRNADGTSAVRSFERRFAERLGADECIAFPFARSAFHATLESLDLPPDSEVILPPITIPPMAEAVAALGLRPVVVDIEPETLLFRPEHLAAAMTDRTRVVMITYLFGIASDPAPLVELCHDAGACVVEDFSHNLGAVAGSRQAGTFGDVGIYSSSATKVLDTFGGGLAVTSDPVIADRLRAAQAGLVAPPRTRLLQKVFRTLVWNVASSRAVWTAMTFPLICWLRKRHPGAERAISGASPRRRGQAGPEPSWFERFTPLQARAGLELLSHLEEIDRTRIGNAEQVRATLRYLGIAIPAGSPGSRHVHWQCVGYIEDVDRVQRALANAGIDAAATNLPLVCLCEPTVCDHPTAAAVIQHAVYLPCHPGVSRRVLARLAQNLVRLRPMPADGLTNPSRRPAAGAAPGIASAAPAAPT